MTPENRIGDWTPGPWVVAPEVSGAAGSVMAGRQQVANTFGFSDPRLPNLRDEQRANVRLCAVGPRLAETALRMYRRLRAMDTDDPEAREALEAAGVKI